MLKMGTEMLDRIPMSERENQGVTFSISEEDLPKVKKLIREFVQNLPEKTKSKKPNQVMQFNVGWTISSDVNNSSPPSSLMSIGNPPTSLVNRKFKFDKK